MVTTKYYSLDEHLSNAHEAYQKKKSYAHEGEGGRDDKPYII